MASNSVVCAFVDVFGQHNDRRLFDNLDQVHAAMKVYQNRAAVCFRVRSTTKDDFGGYKKRVYECTRARKTLQPTSNARNRGSIQTGCRARINFHQFEGYFEATHAVLEHNHPIDAIAVRFEPPRRRLTPAELNEVTPLLVTATPSFSIASIIRSKFKKNVSTKDVCNLRARVLGNRSNAEYLSKLERDLNESGSCISIRNEENFLTHFIYMTDEQKTLCLRYPELLGIDATYGTCRQRYLLYQIVVVDSCGIGIPICFAFLSNETTEAIQTFFQHFKEFVGDIPVRTIITDDCAALQRAISTEFPRAVHLLCRVHIIRHLVKRVSLNSFL